jgi:sulfur carrier protein
MRIFLNGQPISTRKTTLEDLLVEQGFGNCMVATAFNKCFVPIVERQTTLLNDDCEVDVVAPMQGG